MSRTLVIENFKKLAAPRRGPTASLHLPNVTAVQALQWCRENLSPACYHPAGSRYKQTRICFRNEQDLLQLLLAVDVDCYSTLEEEF